MNCRHQTYKSNLRRRVLRHQTLHLSQDRRCRLGMLSCKPIVDFDITRDAREERGIEGIKEKVNVREIRLTVRMTTRPK